MKEPVSIRGLPAPLPPGESILWQGAPGWRSLARRMYHADAAALYFAILVAGTLAAELANHVPLPAALLNELPVLATAVATLAILVLLAWLTARTAEYTVTTARVVMRFGIALPVVLAIPHTRITRVALQLGRAHTGDIPLRLAPGSNLGVLRLWPHARPWRVRSPEPMLRSIPNAAQVATLLGRAVAKAQTHPTPAATRPRRVLTPA